MACSDDEVPTTGAEAAAEGGDERAAAGVETSACALSAVRVEADDGVLVCLTALGADARVLWLSGVDDGGAAVEAEPIARWYLSYATSPPSIFVRTDAGVYSLPALDAVATEAYAPLWRPLVQGIRLVAGLRQATADGHNGQGAVWDLVAPELDRRQQLAYWPFVREQLKALGARPVRKPAPPSPGWRFPELAAASRLEAPGQLAEADEEAPPSARLRGKRKAEGVVRSGQCPRDPRCTRPAKHVGRCRTGGGDQISPCKAAAARGLPKAQGAAASPTASVGSSSSAAAAASTPHKPAPSGHEPLQPWLQPGELLEIQQTRCRGGRYGGVQRCRACAQNRNEQCRFRYMRRLATRDGVVVRSLGTFEPGEGYRLNVGEGDLVGRPPAELAAAAAHARYVLAHIAAPFEELVEEEMALTEGEKVVLVNAKRRGAPPKKTLGHIPLGYSKDGGERQLCDWCSTTVFFRYRTCRRCGFEVCLHCAGAWRREGARPASVLKLCAHAAEDLVVFSKVSAAAMRALCQESRKQLASEISEISEISEQLEEEEEAEPGYGPTPRRQPPRVDDSDVNTRMGHARSDPLDEPARPACAPADASACAPAGASASSAWLESWRAGKPVLVSGASSRLHECWTPSYFSDKFGSLQVSLIDVRSALEFTSPLRAFYAGFARPHERPKPPRLAIASRAPSLASPPGPPLLKLKDWPTSSDFADLLPDHFADLMAALPQQDYTHRRGARNLACRLPAYALPPDLGPKMYVAYGTRGITTGEPEALCLFGTTCLHMDMADAVNLCVFVQPDPAEEGGAEGGAAGGAEGGAAGGAAAPPRAGWGPAAVHAEEVGTGGGKVQGRFREGSGGWGPAAVHAEEVEWLKTEGGPTAGAVWDLWAAEDEPKLSAFLWKLACEESGEDKARTIIGHPIHDANVYLNAAMRRRLWVEEGVRGYRFVQRQGEAVFIPAGCPHQVFNLRSSIKVAEDFVSPEHIRHCLRLTEQARRRPARRLLHPSPPPDPSTRPSTTRTTPR